MLCGKCGKEINIDPTEETDHDGRECPQCGGFYCNECGAWAWKFDDGERVCGECAKEYDRHQIEQWDLVDNAIFDLIEKLNPSAETKIEWTTDGVAEARAEIRETLIRLYCEKLKLCTEDEFYP